MILLGRDASGGEELLISLANIEGSEWSEVVGGDQLTRVLPWRTKSYVQDPFLTAAFSIHLLDVSEGGSSVRDGYHQIGHCRFTLPISVCNGRPNIYHEVLKVIQVKFEKAKEEVNSDLHHPPWEAKTVTHAFRVKSCLPLKWAS